MLNDIFVQQYNKSNITNLYRCFCISRSGEIIPTQVSIKWKMRCSRVPSRLNLAQVRYVMNYGCYRVQSRSSKRIFAWAIPILAQGSKFSLKQESVKKKKTSNFIFSFKRLLYYCLLFLSGNYTFDLKVWLKELSYGIKWILRYIWIV